MKRLNIKYLVVSLIVVLSLFLETSCIYIETPEPAPSSPSSNVTAPTNPDWMLSPADGQDSPLPDFVSVVAKIKPSVVAINTEAVTRDIFNRPFTQEGAGSGWIIDEDGYVVTNNHVVAGAESITVTLDDSRSFPAGIVGTDWLTDLAVIKINAENLTKADIGDSSKLKAGEWVLAIGNSLDLGVTPSEGIVRSLEASVPVSAGQTLYGLIGTSAAINPGNSGGPLVNMQGEVLGITTVKIAMVGVEAMGWAISIKTAIPIIKELINKGYVVRPFLGISYSDVTPHLVWQYDLPVSEGVFVAEAVPGYPAAGEAGLKSGDIIAGFNGEVITNGEEFRLALSSCQIGQRVEIIYWRGDTKNTTYATLSESPPP